MQYSNQQRPTKGAVALTLTRMTSHDQSQICRS